MQSPWQHVLVSIEFDFKFQNELYWDDSNHFRTFSEIFGYNSPIKETSFHKFEDYQSEEANKRCNEIKAIEKKMDEIATRYNRYRRNKRN